MVAHDRLTKQIDPEMPSLMNQLFIEPPFAMIEILFIDEVTRLWLSEIRKRSQRGRSGWTWEQMQRLVRLHLPRPRVTHPYPNERFRARLKVGAV